MSATPKPGMTTSSTRFAVDVQGRPRTYWDTAELAVEAAGRAVFASYDTRTAALAELRAGRPAEWVYGFSEVGIYPPGAAPS